MKQIALLSLVLFAIVALNTQKLRWSVIYMGIFSMSMAFVFLMYSAPDVAIAEAVIGSAFSTILYLVALKKYKVFTVYCHVADQPVHDGLYTKGQMAELIKVIKVYCAKEELEPLVIYTAESPETIMKNHTYEMILEGSEGHIKVACHKENLKVENFRALLESELDNLKIMDVELVTKEEQ